MHSEHQPPKGNQFQHIHHYHTSDPSLLVGQLDLPHISVKRLLELSNDVSFCDVDTNFLSLNLSPTSRHLTQMDGLTSEFATRPGDITQVPKGLEVRYAWDIVGERQETLFVAFDTELFATYAPEVLSGGFAQGHLLPKDYAQVPRLTSLVQLLAGELDPEIRRGRLFAEQAVRLLALELAATGWSRSCKTKEDTIGYDKRVVRALDFIECNFQNNISLLEIAGESGLSVKHMIGLFRRHIGQTPHCYVIERRLRHAKMLLSDTKLSLAEVALSSGFSDQQHMTHTFKSRLRITPSAMRKSEK